MGIWRPIQEILQRVRVDRNAGWRTRDDCRERDVDVRSSRYDLRPARVREDFCATEQPQRGSRRYVCLQILLSGPLTSAGSPWGAGTFAGGDGSRQPSPLELEVAEIQGKQFWEIVSRYQF